MDQKSHAHTSETKVEESQQQTTQSTVQSKIAALEDPKAKSLLSHLSPFLEVVDQQGKVETKSDVRDLLVDAKQEVEGLITDVVDQVEDQVVDLKTSILSLYELLPEDSLKRSGVYVYNTSLESLLSALKDRNVITDSQFGRFIRQIHIHSDLESTKAVHGVHILFPMGDHEKTVADTHARALGHLAEFAQRNCFQVYFSVDVPGIMGLNKYSELPEQIGEWINEYKMSHFHQILTKDIPVKYRRRLCNVFNPYLIDTERLTERYPRGYVHQEQDREMIDKCCWASPVSLMAKQQIRNYEHLGWCGQLFGLDTRVEISSYRNYNPKEEHAGRSFSSSFQNKYSLTLWNFLSDKEFETLRDDCMFTPLQRQAKKVKDEIVEALAFAEAQTLMPVHEDFEEVTQEEYDALSEVRKKEYDGKYQQKMFNSLGTALIEDTICRGLVLITRQFIGRATNQVKEELEKWVEEYMTMFAGKKGDSTEAYDFVPALLDYETACSVSGQRAFVKVKILPNEHIRNVELGVFLSPSHLFYNKEKTEGGRSS